MNTIFKLKQYITSSKHQIVKFLVVGISTTILDLSLLIVLKEKANFHPVFAVATSQIIVITCNFLMNKYWSFDSKKIPLQQFSRYLVLVAINYFSSISLMYLFYEVLGINYKIVRLFSIALLFMINFIVYKHWVYKEI
jgi:putative flippase GtrA